MWISFWAVASSYYFKIINVILERERFERNSPAFRYKGENTSLNFRNTVIKIWELFSNDCYIHLICGKFLDNFFSIKFSTPQSLINPRTILLKLMTQIRLNCVKSSHVVIDFTLLSVRSPLPKLKWRILLLVINTNEIFQTLLTFLTPLQANEILLNGPSAFLIFVLDIRFLMLICKMGYDLHFIS